MLRKYPKMISYDVVKIHVAAGIWMQTRLGRVHIKNALKYLQKSVFSLHVVIQAWLWALVRYKFVFSLPECALRLPIQYFMFDPFKNC